jgi:DNA-binding CsgD family transcriptional regulator
MPVQVSARTAELAALRDFVSDVVDGAAALALEGEAGMGKTTLWTACVEEAQERDLLVLQARPTESEFALAFSGLGDLLDPVLELALEPLPAAQRRALSRALVLGDDDGPPPDPHAVGVAVLSAVRAVAARGPTLVAVDDVQWLDVASSGALAYAARRLRAERVGVLLSRRVSLESPLLSELRRSFPGERFTEVEVGPLAAGAIHHLVQHQLGVVLPRPLLADVHRAAGGNPFYALEIVRTLRRSGAFDAGHPLPVPESLHALVHARLLGLEPESRDFLLAAASYAHPTVAITESASAVGRATGLRPALQAGVVELEGARIRFTHPLLAAGAYEIADPLRRAAIHARLAELLEDPEARAWQLAASTDEPDEHVASALEEAARHARARGACRPAARFLERAGELTPGERPDECARRAVDAAYLHFESGDSRRAETQLRELLAGTAAGSVRARALTRLASIRSYESQTEAADLYRDAIAEAGGDRETLAVAHDGFASNLFRLRERLDEVVEHAELAARLALEIDDLGLAAEALGTRLLPETLLGRETAHATAERALELQDAAEGRRILAQPLFAVATHLWWTDAAETARDRSLQLLRRSREAGDESSLPYVLYLLGQVECTLGDLASAGARALEGRELSEQSGQHVVLGYHLALEGLVAAQRGDVDLARSAATRALRIASETGGRPAEIVATAALGHLDLALSDPRSAASLLGPLVAFARRETHAEPAATRYVVDHLEALIELGRQDEAAALLDWHEGNALRLGRASARAACGRCRGLLAAQSGDVDRALAAYREALDWHAQVELPLDRARTLLALGAAERRVKRRRDARATLEQALGDFERIGAALWAERARAELSRISGRAPTPGALTPAEERVAALVAEGRTNREVAAALFLSERTIEGHLSHVFGKLGVRSRTELARALAARHHGVVSSNTGDLPVSGSPSAP